MVGSWFVVGGWVSVGGGFMLWGLASVYNQANICLIHFYKRSINCSHATDCKRKPDTCSGGRSRGQCCYPQSSALMLEGVDCEQLNLFCSGSPLEDEVNLAALENLTVD